MNDQKNLLLAIVLSIAIIVVFQFFLPQQTMITPQENTAEIQDSQITTSIDQVDEIDTKKIKTREEVINTVKVSGDIERVIIENNNLNGSINLEGAIIDDLMLIQYKESLDENSKFIQLFSPMGTKNPYYLETGWKELTKNPNNIDTLQIWIEEKVNQILYTPSHKTTGVNF